MSKLEELIEQYCPDGVKYVKLGDFATQWYRGAGIKKDEIAQEGIPCIRYGEIHTIYKIWFDKCISHTDEAKQPSKKYADYGDILFAITSEDIPFIGNSVAYMGKDRIMVGGDIVVMKHTQNPKYISYALSTIDAVSQKGKGKVKSKVVHTNVPSLKEIVIPVPPLPVQEEIVRILDTFTELQAELQAELQKRKQQYNYYRDNLLSNGGNNAEYLAIPEFAELKAGKAIKATELSSIMDENHSYPCFGGNGIRGFIKKASHNGDYAIIGRQGALCGCVNWASGEFYATEHAVVCTPRFNVSSRYLYHLFTIADLNQYKSQGAQPGLSVQRLNELVFPIPSIAEQQRIVSILDRFDRLTNDLTSGLPAEIEKRKQQYEYYRDKLLTFKRKGA